MMIPRNERITVRIETVRGQYEHTITLDEDTTPAVLAQKFLDDIKSKVTIEDWHPTANGDKIRVTINGNDDDFKVYGAGASNNVVANQPGIRGAHFRKSATLVNPIP